MYVYNFRVASVIIIVILERLLRVGAELERSELRISYLERRFRPRAEIRLYSQYWQRTDQLVTYAHERKKVNAL